MTLRSFSSRGFYPSIFVFNGGESFKKVRLQFFYTLQWGVRGRVVDREDFRFSHVLPLESRLQGSRDGDFLPSLNRLIVLCLQPNQLLMS